MKVMNVVQASLFKLSSSNSPAAASAAGRSARLCTAVEVLNFENEKGRDNRTPGGLAGLHGGLTFGRSIEMPHCVADNAGRQDVAIPLQAKDCLMEYED